MMMMIIIIIIIIVVVFIVAFSLTFWKWCLCSVCGIPEPLGEKLYAEVKNFLENHVQSLYEVDMKHVYSISQGQKQSSRGIFLERIFLKFFNFCYKQMANWIPSERKIDLRLQSILFKSNNLSSDNFKARFTSTSCDTVIWY